MLISVHDQGAGISDDQLGRLFRRYSRGRERRGEGLGLGLYLSREFVARHGGEIWAESREGQGSTFYVTLPLSPASHNGSEPYFSKSSIVFTSSQQPAIACGSKVLNRLSLFTFRAARGM